MTVSLVVAVARNGVIGDHGDLPWHLPEDLAHFKRLTLDQVLVMGRKTYDSIGRPLPRRTTIVVTRQQGWSAAAGVLVASGVEQALETGRAAGQHVFVVGGAQIFRAALDLVDRLVISHVDLEPEGDTYFPEVDWSRWRAVERVPGAGFDVVTYDRV